MKTCKTGCGKMKAGGSVKKVKKMAKGGSAGCPPGYYAENIGGPCVKLPKTVFKPVAKSTEPKPKGYNDNLVPLNPSDRSTKKIKRYAKGGMAKMAKGGYAPAQKGGDNVKMGIYGMSNAGTTGPNRTAGYDYKTGGVAKAKFGASVGVKASCKNGMVRGADGKCVMSRPKFKSGGSFGMLSVKAGIDKNPKPTAADRIAGAKMNKKKMGGTTRRK